MAKTTTSLLHRRGLLLLGGALAIGGLASRALPSNAAEGRAIPAPQDDISGGDAATSETAILAGGCFWGVQGVYQHLSGVTSAVSGYAGGDRSTASYQRIGRGDTGHAEAVRVVFDPRQISFGRILQVFFSVAHDPTQLNRQGPDVGTQYRSAIFPVDAAQARVARAYIAQLDRARVFRGAIVTRIEADRPFYPAEDYHQDYMTRHPNNPYIAINDIPKVEALQRLFPERYRATPVLVRTS